MEHQNEVEWVETMVGRRVQIRIKNTRVDAGIILSAEVTKIENITCVNEFVLVLMALDGKVVRDFVVIVSLE